MALDPRILIVDDEDTVRETLGILMADLGYEILSAASAEEAIVMMQSHDVDLVLTDMRMGELSGVDVLRQAKKLDSSIEVIILTAYAEAKDAVEAMKLGAYDYLIKPYNIDELGVLVEKALEKRTLGRENQRLRNQVRADKRFTKITVSSPEMRTVYEMATKVADVEVTVLITGESGVGKEVVANFIHDNGRRRDKPFVAVNCGALPESLIEAELFGYVKGAFTGADRDKAGLMEEANGGTLFLDEIGELPLQAQVKLLRVLQEQKVRRVGGKKEVSLDLRVVAATNQDLEQQVQEKTFREDLFYRLNVVRLKIPPLRERREDIRQFVLDFAQKAANRVGVPFDGIDDEVYPMLENYPFPGNVRELANLVERATILTQDNRITCSSFPAEVREASENSEDLAVPRIGDNFNVEEYLESVEKKLYMEAMEKAEGVKSRAAEALGISFRQFRYKASKFGL